jgi:uncharacterized protein HemX
MSPDSARELLLVSVLIALWLGWRVFRLVRKRMDEERERRDAITDELESFEKEHGKRSAR